MSSGYTRRAAELTPRARAAEWARFHDVAERELTAALADYFREMDAGILAHLTTVISTETDPERAADALVNVDRETAALREAMHEPLGAILEAAAVRELTDFEPVAEREAEVWRKRREPVPKPPKRKPVKLLPSELRPDVNAKLAQLIDAPFWVDVSITRRKRIASAIRQGLARRETATQIEKRIRSLFGPRTAPARAALIARTEANYGVNAGAQVVREKLAAAGIVSGKMWLATADRETRPTHLRANGQTRKVTSRFRVGNYYAVHPGDLNLPPGERCNCRCQCVSIPAKDEGE